MKKFMLLLGCLIFANVLIAASSKPAKFEIRAVVDEGGTNSEVLVHAQLTETGQMAEERLYVEKQVLMNQSALKTATVESNPMTGAPEVMVTFTKSGAKRFAEVTRAHAGKRLAFLVDGRVVMAPQVVAEIAGGKAVISAAFSHQQAAELAQRLNRK